MENNEEESGVSQFDADQPIRRRSQDLLGRREFAEAIARDIEEVPPHNGFTVAVIGEWGSGKTSVLNMVEESLRHENSNIIVLRFNPWLFGGAHDLLIRFFSELGAQIGQSNNVRTKLIVGSLLELGATAAPLTPIPGSSPLATLIRAVAKWFGRPQSLLEQRQKLSGALARLDSRIVVVIDDIDRLESGETRELIRLVRLTSDLPNLVFLLAFDWHHVAESLEGAGEDGGEYLDKIVQIRYDIPVIRRTVLSSVLFASLEELQEQFDVLQLDENVWRRVHYDVISPLLSNLRDVRRLVNSLHVTLDTVGTEVALADLLGLEAIRVLAPRTFESLRTNADLLVARDPSTRSYSEEQDRLGAVHRMLGQETDFPLVLKSILDILFPAALSSNSGLFLGYREAEWRKNCRVACDEVWNTYLQLGLGETTLENQQVQLLVAALNNTDQLTESLGSLNELELEEAMERLEGYENDYPTEAITTAVPVLANLLHKLSPRTSNPFAMPPRIKASRIILRLLRKESDKDLLFAKLTELLARVDSLSGWLEIVELVGHNENIGQGLVSVLQAKELEQLLADKLQEATSEELGKEWALIRLLVRPGQWLPADRAAHLYSRLKEHLSDQTYILTLLRAVVGSPAPDSYAQINSNWEALVEVFGDSLLEAVVDLADSPSVRELAFEDRRICDLARKYAGGWRPEDDWGKPW